MQKKLSLLTISELGPLADVRVAKLNLKLCERMRDLEADPKRMLKLAATFWSKVKRGHVRNCWVWNGNFRNTGYGRAVLDNKLISAHRMAYFLYYGAPNAGMCVCHTCDNRKCVNPHHLFVGTFLDNMLDRDNKQRQARGERQGSSILNKHQVNTMRRLYRRCSIKPKILAVMFGVNHHTVSTVLSGRSWRHLL